MALKRNKNLIPFSKEHHLGLLFCWKLRQGIKKHIEPRRIQAFVRHFWENTLSKHFDKEEVVLLSRLTSGLGFQADSQHQAIRSLTKTILLDDNNNLQAYALLADTIEKHIRFEERELFPAIEKSLSPADLDNMGKILLRNQGAEFEVLYPDEFWLE